MFFHLLSVLFALYVLPNVAVDQCNTTLSFDNVDDQEHPPPYRFYTNVSMSIVNWTRIHVVFQDPKIVNPDESLPSNRADLQYLRMPFEVTVKGGRVECMDFSAADNYWSTLIKRKVVNTLWLELEFNSTIYDCFCDDNGTFDEPSGWEKSDVSFCSLHRLGQLNVSEFAEAKNWTAEGYVTAVKDQGDCKSCWAFGTVGLLEFFQKKQTGELLSFSEQSLVDCGRKKKTDLGGCFDTTGATGGTVQLGLSAVSEIGIYSSQAYPWIENDQDCYKPPGAQLYYKRVYPKKPKVTKGNLVETLRKTVVAATVFVGDTSKWHGFRGRMILKDKCRKGKPNHAILLVGFGEYNGEPYYLVKNSWGSRFGDYGYAMLSAFDGENCCLGDFVALE